ncbi:SPOR domain-containing protein [Nitratifractor sp.]|uniref:SPOR domain-containing protein n=1 Tax=Nitratifractor sp. TaxID=2268144 RepID=UPI0025E88F09|nr:SPOR domain-containing protein [Nitratifractor sp.]
MNDHNLDDLIIGEPESHGGKSRNILTLLALLMIILIVGAILAKLILGGDDETLEEKEGNPELTTVVTHPSGKHPSTPRESIPEELKPIVDEGVPPPPPQRPAHRSTPKATQKARQESASLKPVHPLRTKTTSKSRPATHPTKPKPSELFHTVRKSRNKAKESSAASKTYTIQIGAFKRPPTQKFLDEIQAKGYTPLIVKSGGVIKVRIGSWGSYAEAKSHLPEIKEKLGISGFVVRRK